MCIIDEKQEAIARIRMAIDNDRKARLNLEAMEDISENELALDLEPGSSKTWRLGSPEGKKTNLRVTAIDLANANPQYCSLDERLRDFIACNMPEEAVQMHFEDDIYVSLEFSILISNFHLEEMVYRCNGINVLLSSISRWKTGLKELILCDATQIFMAGSDLTVLLFMMTHQNSVLLDSTIYFAFGFHLGRHSI